MNYYKINPCGLQYINRAVLNSYATIATRQPIGTLVTYNCIYNFTNDELI